MILSRDKNTPTSLDVGVFFNVDTYADGLVTSVSITSRQVIGIIIQQD